MKSFYSTALAKTLAVSAALFAGAVLNCAAHSVWIQHMPGKGLVVCFGEFPEEFETSPGHLDELHGVIAWKPGQDGKPLMLQAGKKEDHFQLLETADTNSVQIETSFEVLPSTNGPARKPYFYARWQPKGADAGACATTLDIVPTGKTGEVRVYFRGQPVPDAKLSLIVPGSDEKALTSDKEGFVHYTATEPGMYLLTYSHHRENITGYSGGAAYGIASHNASLCWQQ